MIYETGKNERMIFYNTIANYYHCLSIVFKRSKHQIVCRIKMRKILILKFFNYSSDFSSDSTRARDPSVFQSLPES